MKKREWCWVGACSTGSSHLRAGTGCQDNASCIELVTADDSVLVATISDGAGSAEFSALGSRLVVECFARCTISYLRAGKPADDISEEIVREWLDDVRERIFYCAKKLNVAPRQMAATLVGVIVCSRCAILCHIGDGACVLRRKGNSGWEVPSWPAHGEYASSTYFLTDDPQPHLKFFMLEGEFSELALFSDGLERLALDFTNKSPFNPFFDAMFAPLSKSDPGRNRALSVSLRKYLDSPRVTERTDDDKSLVLGRRAFLE
jgi:hypothetical protein